MLLSFEHMLCLLTLLNEKQILFFKDCKEFEKLVWLGEVHIILYIGLFNQIFQLRRDHDISFALLSFLLEFCFVLGKSLRLQFISHIFFMSKLFPIGFLRFDLILYVVWSQIIKELLVAELNLERFQVFVDATHYDSVVIVDSPQRLGQVRLLSLQRFIFAIGFERLVFDIIEEGDKAVGILGQHPLRACKSILSLEGIFLQPLDFSLFGREHLLN